ncbi:hypothetical protein TNIN_369801 [Trichonephila inaurata madagascariensis]|uniref:Uncharacterized protein n=1 Tax=Trichonephila inaurata madagascariensis TaxID=2747483 RepID=A0A8X6K422_9ARAC|nr:hypothetical protein TNIN_369801 [Trichonephila inaurata madagascariensis]
MEKNRLRKRCLETRYPPLKTAMNKFQREIRKDLVNIKQREWDATLVESNSTDASLYKMHCQIKQKTCRISPSSRLPRPGLRDERES